MSFWYKISRVMKPREETSDHAKHPDLKTRYYGASFTRVFRKAKQLENESGNINKLIKADEERGEVFVEATNGKDRFDVIMTIVQVGPNETAIDIVSSIRNKAGDWGKNFPIIVYVLKEFDQSFPNIKKG
ncbi:hypothetical protein J2S78_001760 [Salibacterium salarium]|uniref:hypothetical protein n=1 Tax=Salibacterium salarium TaxID=284579 RepID=UPI0027889B6E|nr:hypothetical protein [Salibacterium salarium]MDQ0299340.1 hypothetical protein [Salibacterium salarium]